jgi:hypothetical protein
MLGKINGGVINVFSNPSASNVNAMVMMVDKNFNFVWIKGFANQPIMYAFAVTPNGQDLFLSMFGSPLILFNLNAQTGAVKGVLTESNMEVKINQAIVPNPDSTGIYFVGNNSVTLNVKTHLKILCCGLDNSQFNFTNFSIV